MKHCQRVSLLICIALLAVPCRLPAEDVYYQLPVSALKITDGTFPEETPGWAERARWQLGQVMQTYAVLDGAGEIYVNDQRQTPWDPTDSAPARVFIRAVKDAEISGRLFVPNPGWQGMTPLKFKVVTTDLKATTKEVFFRAKANDYEALLNRNIPGAAWFRHEANDAARLSGQTNAAAIAAFASRRRGSELEESYDLFTGGRALSENLQLDRAVAATKSAEATVAITNLTGITVKEMNWKELIQDAKPELDPLAACLPADQHAVFFPTFEAMLQVIDEADANGTPVLQLLEPRSEDANARSRYQKQLCLGLSDLSRLFGPKVIASVAFTGSDPFLRVGTDVAVVLEARNVDLLKGYLAAQQQAALSANSEAKAVKGSLNGAAFAGVITPDRSICSYVAAVSNVVFISNSKVQLENLVRVATGAAPALSSQDEYVFFRKRYPRSDKDEAAFAVLTDATIRRWCGPQWRIADSRRTRAAAVLAELQAAHLDELASGKVTEAVLTNDYVLPDAGELRLTRAGVVSANYGSLNFMTPISEMPLAQVTQAEADAYQRWRDSYQRNWRQFFDPVAVRFSVAADHLGAEITVMPLIVATDYRQIVEFTSGAQIAPDAGDPHTNTLVHLALAVNTQSHPVEQAGSLIANLAPGLKVSPFGWLGQCIALYADEDPFWDRLVQATNSEAFLEHNFTDLPLALHFEVKNPLGLAAFLTGLHAFVDQSAPQMTTWNNLEYNGKPYVKVVSRSGSVPEDGPKEVAVYYAATPRALIVTLSEPLLKRALDRQVAGATDGKDKSAPIRAWLGKSFCVAAEHRLIAVVQQLTRDDYDTRLQMLAWSNLPVLNEWKRRYPDKDPVKLHEQLWGTKLLCPGGGTYVWNEPWQTMESTRFGHPGEPKTSSSKTLDQILGAQFGVTFENQGLTAKGQLQRSAAK